MSSYNTQRNNAAAQNSDASFMKNEKTRELKTCISFVL